MNSVLCNSVSKGPAGCWGCFESAIAPAAVEIEPFNMGAVDDWRAIHRHIHNATPHAQKPHTAEHGEYGHCPLADIFNNGQVSALGVGIIAVYISAKDQAALIRLAAIKMSGPKGDHSGQHRLEPLGDEGLQHMAFNGRIFTGVCWCMQRECLRSISKGI